MRDAIIGHIPQLEMRYISSLLWCFVQLGFNDIDVTSALIGAVPSVIKGAKPQCCSNIMHALAKSKNSHADTARIVVDAFIPMLGTAST